MSHYCTGCGCPKARCDAYRPPAIKCCPDCSHSVPPYVKLMRAMRASIEAFDAEDANAPDRHPSACSCGICEFVRDTRRLVEDYEEEPK